MPKDNGYCLVSQQIRELIKKDKIITNLSSETDIKGQFKDSTLESRVQPASFEPTLGDRILILDSEHLSAFLPHFNETVDIALSKIPKRQRPETELTPDFEVKKEYTYLIPLKEKFILEKEDYIKSSPKTVSLNFFIANLVTSKTIKRKIGNYYWPVGDNSYGLSKLLLFSSIF